MFRRICILLFLAASLLPLGCGGKTKDGDDDKDKDGNGGTGIPAVDRRSGNSVSGTIMVKGQHVAGIVTFVGADSKEHGPAPVNAEGRYFIEDAPAGKYTVVVRPMLGAPPPLPGEPKVDLPDPPTTMPGVAPPARYADAKKSGLTFEVTKGEQTFNIELAQ